MRTGTKVRVTYTSRRETPIYRHLYNPVKRAEGRRQPIGRHERTDEVIRVLTTERCRVLFSGSAEAYAIWREHHHVPIDAVIETIKPGPSGLAQGRRLQPSVNQNDGALTTFDTDAHLHGCHSSRRGGLNC